MRLQLSHTLSPLPQRPMTARSEGGMTPSSRDDKIATGFIVGGLLGVLFFTISYYTAKHFWQKWHARRRQQTSDTTTASDVGSDNGNVIDI